MKKTAGILFLTAIILAAMLASQSRMSDAASGRTGKDVYESACMGCHGTGGALKPGAAEWKRRRAENGINGLLRSALSGKGVMPPRGSCMQCPDDEIGRAVGYLAGISGRAGTQN